MKKETRILFITISLNLLIAFIIFYCLLSFKLSEVFDFIQDFFLNFSIGIIGLYASAYGCGLVLSKMNRIRIYHGILTSFLVLFIGTLAGSTVGFIQEGLPSTIEKGPISEAIFNYYTKPLFWIFFFGFIPTLISGLIIGKLLRK
ncbi:hypothetical protein ABE545_19250 [Sphingobacterium faecium]|uniref:hypothetical protein n=1 Tax=Sphingobacterium faecium TaxID=34087 RepID=UPI003209C2DF